LAALSVLLGKALAVTIDGTGSVVFEQTQHVFGNGDSAIGAVCFNAGFTIPSSGTVTTNILFPVAGAIDLGGDGTLHLDGDVSLASNASISNGGKIDGNDNVIFLDGNITITAGTTIECTSNLVIDGQGHELVFESGSPGGILLINGSNGTTLTLRNIVVRGLMDYGSNECSIMFGSDADQKLILENATCYLADDMIFSGGVLDIKGVSAIKGWHMFDYQAPYDLTILADSTLFVDMHTTLKYNPSDRLRTHLVLPDKTARLFLCGATLDVPATTGLMLTYGHLVIDHKTIFSGHGATREAGSIMFGDSEAAHNLYIDIFPAANLDVSNGFLTYNNSL